MIWSIHSIMLLLIRTQMKRRKKMMNRAFLIKKRKKTKILTNLIIIAWLNLIKTLFLLIFQDSSWDRDKANRAFLLIWIHLWLIKVESLILIKNKSANNLAMPYKDRETNICLSKKFIKLIKIVILILIELLIFRVSLK